MTQNEYPAFGFAVGYEGQCDRKCDNKCLLTVCLGKFGKLKGAKTDKICSLVSITFCRHVYVTFPMLQIPYMQ